MRTSEWGVQLLARNGCGCSSPLGNDQQGRTRQVQKACRLAQVLGLLCRCASRRRGLLPAQHSAEPGLGARQQNPRLAAA
jgi:hypothetical protein